VRSESLRTQTFTISGTASILYFYHNHSGKTEASDAWHVGKASHQLVRPKTIAWPHLATKNRAPCRVLLTPRAPSELAGSALELTVRRYTRREALAGLAVAARAADTAKASNYIDAHVHVWTPDRVSFPHDKRRKGRPVPPISFTPEQLLTLARPSGVSRIVLIQMSFYGTDNSYMLDALKRYPTVFSGVGILDHQAPGVHEEMTRLAALGVRGYRITPGVETSTWLDSPECRRCGGVALRNASRCVR
jgi:hypothetical protein